MIDKTLAIKIIKSFINKELVNKDWYKNCLPHIKAILLYGSVAKGTNKPDSDIDVLIILPLKIEEKFTKGEYFYNYKNHEINIVLRSIEKLRIIAKENKDAFQKEVFRNSVIVKSFDDEVQVLIDKIINI